MESHTTAQFRAMLVSSPEQVQRQAREAYSLFRQNPYHPSLHFKHIHATKSIYSVRIGVRYRAIGVRDGNDIVWFWIGSHADYDDVVARLSSKRD